MNVPQAQLAQLVRGFLQLCDRTNGIWVLAAPQLSLCLCFWPKQLHLSFFFSFFAFCQPCFPVFMVITLIFMPPNKYRKLRALQKLMFFLTICLYEVSMGTPLHRLQSSVALPPSASQHHLLKCNLSPQGSSSYQSSHNCRTAIPSWHSAVLHAWLPPSM